MHYVKKKKKPATSTAAQAEANAISKTTTKIYEQHWKKRWMHESHEYFPIPSELNKVFGFYNQPKWTFYSILSIINFCQSSFSKAN